MTYDMEELPLLNVIAKTYCIMKIFALLTQLALLLVAISASPTKLSAQQPFSKSCSMPLLRRNDYQKKPNQSVRILQRRLREYNLRVKVDGFFGKETEDGVIEYQSRGSDHDPNIRVDGIVGEDTWKSLLICPR